ncbi:MAG: FAD:protein FMN transferase [Candidatus Alcyoniella australis]|nr:FAD:protein FMN transferase [Candidatus Alcyoniella australis]
MIGPRNAPALLCLILLVFALGCSPDHAALSPRVYRFERMQLGTQVQISLVAPTADVADIAADAAFAQIDRIEARLSDYRPDSEISQINSAAGRDWVVVSDETFKLIELANQISQRSNGAFDLSFKGLGLWSFGRDNARPPDPAQIAQRLPLIDFRLIELDPQRRAVRLATPGAAISLGGMAKGYAVHRAVEVLRSHGIDAAIVNAGGDLYALGEKPAGPWSVGVQHPREIGKLLATIEPHDAAVVTSGDYERFFIYQGKRYHHIIDPRTGWPADGCMSVTIIALDPTLADALATAVFVLGPEQGMELIESMPDVEVLIVDNAGSVTSSSGAAALGLKLVR